MDGNDSSAPSRSISTTLLKRAQEHDDLSWRRLVELFFPFVTRRLRAWGVPECDVADVAQNVFLNVARGIATFHRDQPGASFRGWIWTITRNERNNYLRKLPEPRRADVALEEIPETDESDETFSEESAMLHKVIEMVRVDFEPTTYQVFWRCHFEGRLLIEIAADLGLSDAAARQSVRRFRTRLKDECLELFGNGFWPRGN